MQDICWAFYPQVAQNDAARRWIEVLTKLQKAPKTVDVYARGLDELIAFFVSADAPLIEATRGDIACYLDYLHRRPNTKGATSLGVRAGVGLSHSTIQQRLTVARLWYDYLIDTRIRVDQHNPVGRGVYARGVSGGPHERGILRRQEPQPWIPNDYQWGDFLTVVLRDEPLRNQAMVLLAYDGALRRSELVALQVADIDWPHNMVTIRAETTKTGRGRVVFFGEATQCLLSAYLPHRREVVVRTGGASAGPLFLSESHRNAGSALSEDMWNKIIERIRDRAGLPRFKTHTFRHLRLTDLARCQLELYEIARYAGHRSLQSTQLYLNLNPMDLAIRVRAATASLDARLAQRLSSAMRDR